MKGELTQAKKQLEKIYSNNEKIDEQLFYHRSSYNKIGLGYLIGEKLAKKIEVRKELELVVETINPKENDQNGIKPTKSTKVSKEVEQVNFNF